MADPSAFKLFRTVDPTTVKVPIKEKFAKLTLSSNKKKQLEKDKTKEKPISSSVSRQLLADVNNTVPKSYEHPLLRSDSSSSVVVVMGLEENTPKSLQLDVSDYMEALQLSGDGCTQRTLDIDGDVDVEQLSTKVSNLTMQQETKQQPHQEISICITSTTEDEDSCIIISDTSRSEVDPDEQKVLTEEEQLVVEESMAVGEQPLFPTGDLLGASLATEKVERIQAFLRDVSFERHEMLRRGLPDMSANELLHSHLASADTESMSQDIDSTHLSTSPAFSSTKRPLDCSKLLADNETEVNTVCSEIFVEPEPDSSKRLADNDTEVNTICSDEQLEQDNSKRLAANDTEVNTLDMDESLAELSAQHSTLNDIDPNESIIVPETSCETEQSPARPSSATSAGSAETGTEAVTSAVQVSSINISAKINIKIHIPNMDSSSAESGDADSDSDASENNVESPPVESEKQEQQRQEKKKERSMLREDASEDEQFLTNAEQLLNQLYGRSWQTPDVIRTLKRSSGSGGKVAAPTAPIDRTPLTEIRRQPRALRAAATTTKKRIPDVTANESSLGDFTICRHLESLNMQKII